MFVSNHFRTCPSAVRGHRPHLSGSTLCDRPGLPGRCGRARAPAHPYGARECPGGFFEAPAGPHGAHRVTPGPGPPASVFSNGRTRTRARLGTSLKLSHWARALCQHPTRASCITQWHDRWASSVSVGLALSRHCSVVSSRRAASDTHWQATSCDVRRCSHSARLLSFSLGKTGCVGLTLSHEHCPRVRLHCHESIRRSFCGKLESVCRANEALCRNTPLVAILPPCAKHKTSTDSV